MNSQDMIVVTVEIKQLQQIARTPPILYCFHHLSCRIGGCYHLFLAGTPMSIVNENFLVHLSWKLKWAFLITCRPSSVCLSLRPFVNFSHFHLLLQNHWANFNQTWHKASLGEGDSSLFEWRVPSFSKLRGDNNEIVKIHWRNLKIIFSRTT